MKNKFIDYLAGKFNQNENEFTVNGGVNAKFSVDNGSVNVNYVDGRLTVNANYGTFSKKHQSALKAFIDDYKEGVDKLYSLNLIDGQINLKCVKYDVTDEQAISVVENVIAFFSNDTITGITNSAVVRAKVVKDRVDVLKKRASIYEEEGNHDLAMSVFDEISKLESNKDFSIYESMAFFYSRGIKGKNLKFPQNDDYALKCYELAYESGKFSVLMPYFAYKTAMQLGKTDVADKFIEAGQKRGTWNVMALSKTKALEEPLHIIADCYHKGIGCKQNDEHAKFYERLASGERQSVFKEMLESGFEPVFDLMTSEEYYKIQSLSELDGLSNEFKNKYLYGDNYYCGPSWILPLISQLNESDRAIIVDEYRKKLTAELENLKSKLESGEYKIVSIDGGGEILDVETPDGLQSLVLGLHLYETCGLTNKYRSVIDQFITRDMKVELEAWEL